MTNTQYHGRRFLNLRFLFILSLSFLHSSTTPTSTPPPTQTSTPTPTFSHTNVDCARELLEPDQPFRVIWNHPDFCVRDRVPLNLSDYGIVHNTGRTFLGDQIQTLYRVGVWPTIGNDNSYHSGGLPQLMNTTTFPHTRSDLAKNRINNFTGLAIIDFEVWRAIFNTNFGSLGRYQTESRRLVQRQHPEYNPGQVYKAAEAEWQAAARRVMGSKLAIGQELMPRGHWGFYLYPRAWAGTSSVFQNNKLEWLWRQATGLYPSIYLTNPNASVESKVARVSKEMTEAVRIQSTFSPPNTPIYPFSNLQQGPYLFFSEDHMRVPIGLSADMGASGVVLWGSSSLYRTSGQCQRVSHYIHDVLGPYVRNLTQFTKDCSQTLCGGHGRCVHNDKDSLLSSAESLSLSGNCTSRESVFRDYHCRCYSYWSGPCCQVHNPSPCQRLTENHVTGQQDLIG